MKLPASRLYAPLKSLALVLGTAPALTLAAATALAQAEDGPIPISVDVAFLFDRSGSFSDDLTTFRAVSSQMTSAIAGQVDDLAVGLSSFIDAPCVGFGQTGEFGYRAELALTTDHAALADRLASLSVMDGDDAPEAQLEGMVQALTGIGRIVNRGDASCRTVADIPTSDTGWRTKTLKFLFVSTDSAFHRPTDVGYPYPTTADDVITAANARGVRVYFLYAGGTPDADAVKIALATDGEVRKLAVDSAGMADLVEELVMEAVREEFPGR